jgi:demethylmenaquinone methyltransferase/2-methoxy-6-polyprenyl-1,4-benzoquinol methylase
VTQSSADPDAVRRIFETIAPRYDQLNDVLSLGLHRLWKRQLLHQLRPNRGEHWLDLCCGTGDLALLLAARVRPGGSVLGLDAAEAPLQEARRRARCRPWLALDFQRRDALATDLATGGFDGAVMAYGLRNVADPAVALRELRRLLRPGGRAGILDFNPWPADTREGRFQRFYLRRIVVPAASLAGLAEQYAYIERSLAAFPAGAAQVALAHAAGFASARHIPLVAGQMGMLLLRT